MARPLRIEFPGALYHVTSRGDRREPIFVDDDDRRTLLSVVEHTLNRLDACALAYCLMGNHYHFVLHTRQANLSALMRQINGIYTQRFNRRHSQVGHLFQGRFKAVLVDRDSYLLEVCRYVDLNPVRAGLVSDPAAWAWSSYRALTAQAPPPAWLYTAAVWGHLTGAVPRTSTQTTRAAQRYLALVQAGRDVNLWDRGLQQQIFLGDDAFVERMQQVAEPNSPANPNIPKAQRAKPKTLTQWLKTCATREEALARTHRESHWTMTRMADALGLSVQHVSRLIARWEKADQPGEM